MTAPMADTRLAEIEQAEAKASPGPWDRDGFSLGAPDDDGEMTHLGYIDVADIEDVEFIAVARTAVPELLAEVKRLRAHINESNTQGGTTT